MMMMAGIQKSEGWHSIIFLGEAHQLICPKSRRIWIVILYIHLLLKGGVFSIGLTALMENTFGK
jgi:hypothetical protein